MSAYLSVTLSYCVKKAKDVEIYYHFLSSSFTELRSSIRIAIEARGSYKSVVLEVAKSKRHSQQPVS